MVSLIIFLSFIGEMWLKYFSEALLFKGSKKVKEEYFFTIVFNYYLVNYYSPANSNEFKLTTNSE